MKKTTIFAILGILIFTPEFSQATDNQVFNKSEIHQTNDGGRKNKNGSYRRKKGFMWGLFRKKSQCDCPKH